MTMPESQAMAFVAGAAEMFGSNFTTDRLEFLAELVATVRVESDALKSLPRDTPMAVGFDPSWEMG